MFGYGYKEDALKLRAHHKRLDDAETSKSAKMVCKVHLIDGDVLEYVLEDKSREVRFFDRVYIHHCEIGIEEDFRRMCAQSNDCGIHINGSFYPSAQIKRIERGEIEVTTNA